MYFCQICNTIHKAEVTGTIYKTAYKLIDGKHICIGFCSDSQEERAELTAGFMPAELFEQ